MILSPPSHPLTGYAAERACFEAQRQRLIRQRRNRLRLRLARLVAGRCGLGWKRR